MAKQSITNFDVQATQYILQKRMAADETFSDYNFEGGGLAAILRLLAMDSNNLAFLANMLSGESHLLTAQQRSNAALAAQMLSYTPYNHRAAYMYGDVVVTPFDVATAPDTLVMDSKAMFVGAKDGKTYPFTVSESIQTSLVDGKYLFKNVKFIQGTWMYKTYTVEGSAISSYPIPSEDVDIDYIRVQVQADSTVDTFTTFSRYQTPYQLDQYSNLFFIDLGINGRYNIEFGDGYISRRLEDLNEIFVQYLATDGVDGNDITSLSAASSIGGFSRIDITLPDNARSVGGSEPESIENMQRMAPLAFQADGSAIAEGDYGVLLKKLFSNVAQARAYGGETLETPSSGYVYIAAIPSVGETFTAEEKADMEAQLDKYNVGSITPKIVDAEIYYINVNTLLFWDPTATAYTVDQLKALVKDKIVSWGMSALQGFSGIFDRQTLADDITKFERSINSNITTVSFRKNFSPTPGVSEAFSIGFGRSIKEGSVSVKGFKPVPAEVDYTYAMRDAAGVLNLYKINADGKEFAVGPIGDVDYTKGLVDISSFMVSKFDTGGIRVTVSPAGDDQNFTSVNNQILRIGDINVDTEVRYVNRA
ncbi:baseplate wedge subunit [Erwinia phage vB_EamM-Bue1]|uniref:Baseplate wedge subunit n=2 Tax=Nezavisimistyvirus TaxID=2841279 RepID=A0A0A0YVM2_9CAUD|nr:baseplate wedge subunit [Erwinia phage phiEa2809]YP_009837755.1 baseplate wedge subunit [Erwinia phage vB_EamM-Bue1]AIX13136.1 baseplate wedge subunit [Erwinia phage phiEa2809]AVO22993.1 baseplate wedge subunit [Erwinia phage vB_EamM-Bue1]